VETVLGIVFTIRTLPLHSLVAVNAVMGPLTTAYSTASVVTDWYIAGAMCFLFIRNRSRSRYVPASFRISAARSFMLCVSERTAYCTA
jgi:hypothetical protein